MVRWALGLRAKSLVLDMLTLRHRSGDGEEADGSTDLEFGERSGLGIRFWET